MTIATRKFTWTEYLSYDDGTDTRYELVDGDLIPTAVGTGKHGSMIEFLNEQFKQAIQQAGQPWTSKEMKIAVRSPRGGRWDTARIPDVVVLPIAQWEAMADTEAVIELNTPPPLLVVEVVSESTVSTDYRSKHTEYAVLDILEYWIADPFKQQVTICQWEEGRYDDTVFQDDQAIVSKVFPDLTLTATQILTGKP